MDQFGATGLAGGQVTIKKMGLLSTLTPTLTNDNPAGGLRDLRMADLAIIESQSLEMNESCLEVVDQVSTILANLPTTDERWNMIDKLGHYIWASLYGRDPQADYGWWTRRTKGELCPAGFDEMWEAFKTLRAPHLAVEEGLRTRQNKGRTASW